MKKNKRKLCLKFAEPVEGRFDPIREFANSGFVQGRSAKKSGDPFGRGKNDLPTRITWTIKPMRKKRGRRKTGVTGKNIVKRTRIMSEKIVNSR